MAWATWPLARVSAWRAWMPSRWTEEGLPHSFSKSARTASTASGQGFVVAELSKYAIIVSCARFPALFADTEPGEDALGDVLPDRLAGQLSDRLHGGLHI